MSVDPRTLGWVSRALSHEMRAVQQYLAQSVVARLWGDSELSARLRQEAVQELAHAERLMEHLIRLGVSPSAGHLVPARLGRDAEDLLAADRELEVEAVRLYQDACAHAERMRDAGSAAVLAGILAEEMEHVHDIDSMRKNRG
ncbi:MAG: ferritin-like domain-containing protein [Acidiferrobacteraceae bacterium]